MLHEGSLCLIRFAVQILLQIVKQIPKQIPPLCLYTTPSWTHSLILINRRVDVIVHIGKWVEKRHKSTDIAIDTDRWTY
jgi:hypothetical protein